MVRKIAFVLALLAGTPALAQPGAAPAASPSVPSPAQAAALIDINSATAEQLAGLKGLDKTFAEAIVKGRPYKSTDDLVKNKILPEAVFARVKETLTVRHN